MKKYRSNRIIALLVCVAVCVRFALSTAFITKNADHQCNSEGCSICVQIKAVQKQIKQLKTAIVRAVVFLFCVFGLSKFVVLSRQITKCFTLINLKTELLN